MSTFTDRHRGRFQSSLSVTRTFYSLLAKELVTANVLEVELRVSPEKPSANREIKSQIVTYEKTGGA
jgi:hypothetical protein